MDFSYFGICLECAFNVSEIVCDASIFKKWGNRERSSRYSLRHTTDKTESKIQQHVFLCCYAALHIEGHRNGAKLSRRLGVALLVVTDGMASCCLREKRTLWLFRYKTSMTNELTRTILDLKTFLGKFSFTAIYSNLFTEMQTWNIYKFIMLFIVEVNCTETYVL